MRKGHLHEPLTPAQGEAVKEMLAREEQDDRPIGEILRSRRRADAIAVLEAARAREQAEGPQKPTLYLGKPRSFSPRTQRQKASNARRNAENQ